MALVYFPLNRNPTAYVWDPTTHKLYSTSHGQKYNCPNGLYELKECKNSVGQKGYKVSLWLRGPRVIFTMSEIKSMFEADLPVRYYQGPTHALTYNDLKSLIAAAPVQLVLPEKRFVVLGRGVELLTREEALEQIKRSASSIPYTFQLAEVVAIEQVEVAVKSHVEIVIDGDRE